MPPCRLIVSHRIQLWLAILTICVAYAGADILVFSTADKHQVLEELSDVPALFGGLIPPEGMKGMVLYAEPPEACGPIARPPNDTVYDGKWIVLISRFNCTFEKKIRMAQDAGYDTAIVHNVNSNGLEPMSAQNQIGINIQSVFVGEDTGYLLRNNFMYYDGYFVLIKEDLLSNSIPQLDNELKTSDDSE